MMKISQNTFNQLKSKYGNWVLITGATSGTGKDLAYKMAEGGGNMVITGRRNELLEKIATELFDKYRIEAIPLAGDLSQESDVRNLLQETAHLNIEIIVLNAGYGTSGKFIQSNVETELNMLDLNCRSLLLMTHTYANRMKDAGRGAIVLLNSLVAFQGVPNAANYTATKAYVQTLGEGLGHELKPWGIDVLNIAPGPVNTGFGKRANMQMGKAMTPEKVSTAIIKNVGKRKTILPGFMTKFLAFNLGLAPRRFKVGIMGKVMSGITQHQNA